MNCLGIIAYIILGIVVWTCDCAFCNPVKESLSSMYLDAKRESQTSEIAKKGIKPYLLMVTSLDETISSTPLLDVKSATVKLLNESPFHGVTLNLIDIYSGQSVPDEEMVIDKANRLKKISTKDIWVRVNLNRIYQRGKTNTYYKSRGEIEMLKGSSIYKKQPLRKIREMSTPYFDNIKGMDIYDETGALSDFYKIWALSLKFCKIMNSGIVFDLEDYSRGEIKYRVSNLALAQGKSIDEVVKRLEEIGKQLVDIAMKEYPEITVLCLSTYHYRGEPQYDNIHFPPSTYISQGMLMRAKEKQIPLKIVEGGVSELAYINKTLDPLREKIKKSSIRFHDWLSEYGDNFYLGGTITVWDDPMKITGWVRDAVGNNSPFKSLSDFKPYLKELFSNYDYIWIYVPMIIGYNPFDPIKAPVFNQKLSIVIKDVLKDMRDEIDK